MAQLPCVGLSWPLYQATFWEFRHLLSAQCRLHSWGHFVWKKLIVVGVAAGPRHENHEVHFRMAVIVMKSFHSRERSEENWEPFKLNLPIHTEFVEKDVYLYTLQGINISHLGKRKIIFKMPFLGDMLVPWRVYYIQRFLGLPCCILSQTLSDTFDSLHLGAWQKSCSIFLTFSDIHCEEIPPSKPPKKTSLPCPLVFWSHDFEPKIERNLRQNYFILKSASFNDHVLSFRHFGSSESIQTTKSVLGRLVNTPNMTQPTHGTWSCLNRTYALLSRWLQLKNCCMLK